MYNTNPNTLLPYKFSSLQFGKTFQRWWFFLSVLPLWEQTSHCGKQDCAIIFVILISWYVAKDILKVVGHGAFWYFIFIVFSYPILIFTLGINNKYFLGCKWKYFLILKKNAWGLR